MTLGSRLPERAKKPLRLMRDFIRGLPYHGTGRYCPVCSKSSRRFRSFGAPPRQDAQCPRCGSLERHRLLWLYLTTQTDLFSGATRRMLHVAPELCFESRLRRHLGRGYLSGDLHSSVAMVRMDITSIEYPDQSFDVIYCSHVLEHVDEDRKAMGEFYRVLKDTGWAILVVPISAEATYEDPSLTSPEERMEAFGQADHVRRYGPDYVDRLRQAGFCVRILGVGDLVDKDRAIEMGLTAASGQIFLCTK